MEHSICSFVHFAVEFPDEMKQSYINKIRKHQLSALPNFKADTRCCRGPIRVFLVLGKDAGSSPAEEEIFENILFSVPIPRLPGRDRF